VRGAYQPKAPLTRRVAKTSPTRGEVKSDLCNNAHYFYQKSVYNHIIHMNNVIIRHFFI
jgi:hypothetical protein